VLCFPSLKVAHASIEYSMAVTGNREPLISWRRSCFVLLAILFLTFVVNSLPRTKSVASTPPSSIKYKFGDAKADLEGVDGLTDAQCDAQFPELYSDIDRAATYWKQTGHKITASDVDISEVKTCMRILIHNNELRILESKHAVDPMGSSPDRALGVLHLFQRALDASMAAGEELPTVELALNFEDASEPPEAAGDTHTFLAAARTIGKESHERIWLMPNFDFWYYKPTGSFSDAKRDAMQHDAPLASKIGKIVWRGNPSFNEEIRGGLIEKTTGKDWADVASVQSSEHWMKVDEFCKYAMTVYTEGVTYSGRLKFLMNCDSLLFAHDAAYQTHYSHLLKRDGPQQNYIAVKRDWSDLEDKVNHYLTHPEEAETIVANSLQTFRSRYITRAATSCYIRRLIRRYGDVSEAPEVHVAMKGRSGVRLRGYSYEKFMDKPQDLNFEDLE
jgi:hypothetical protein